MIALAVAGSSRASPLSLPVRLPNAKHAIYLRTPRPPGAARVVRRRASRSLTRRVDIGRSPRLRMALGTLRKHRQSASIRRGAGQARSWTHRCYATRRARRGEKHSSVDRSFLMCRRRRRPCETQPCSAQRARLIDELRRAADRRGLRSPCCSAPPVPAVCAGPGPAAAPCSRHSLSKTDARVVRKGNAARARLSALHASLNARDTRPLARSRKSTSRSRARSPVRRSRCRMARGTAAKKRARSAEDSDDSGACSLAVLCGCIASITRRGATLSSIDA